MLVLYKIINKFYFIIYKFSSSIYFFLLKKAFRFNLGKNYTINGFPRFILKMKSKLVIGENFSMNSGNLYNPIGRNQRCLISVSKDAFLKIGDNVGLSSVAIVCQKKITIGNNVRIGGNTIIYDTDFHSLNSVERTSIPENATNIKRKEVSIGDNVFIGGHSLILKGVSIGDNAIIGAGSVVSKSVPPNEIWAGNPAVQIRKNI